MTDNLGAEIAKRRCGGSVSLAALAVALGMGESGRATLSRIVRGEAVSAAARRDVARRLGIQRPPRRLIRAVMSAAEHAAWRACPPGERVARLLAPLGKELE